MRDLRCNLEILLTLASSPPMQSPHAQIPSRYTPYNGFMIASDMHRGIPPLYRVEMEEMYSRVRYGEPDCGSEPVDDSLPSNPSNLLPTAPATASHGSDKAADIGLASPGETTAIGDFDDVPSPMTDAPSSGGFSFAQTLVGTAAQDKQEKGRTAFAADVASPSEQGGSKAVRLPASTPGVKRGPPSTDDELLDDAPSPKRSCLELMHVSPHMNDQPRTEEKNAAVEAWVHAQPPPLNATIDPPSPIQPFEPSPARPSTALPSVQSSSATPSPIEPIPVPLGFEPLSYNGHTIHRADPLPHAECPLPGCNSTFAYSKADCGIHLAQHHNISRNKHDRVSCPYGGCPYTGNAKDFGRHFMTHVAPQGPTFWCQFCNQPRNCRDASDMNRHMSRNHPHGNTASAASSSRSATMPAPP